MYGNLAWNGDDFFSEGQMNMTISAGEYMQTSLVQQRKPTTEAAAVPAWRSEVIERLDELVRLGPDWNSYGARAVPMRLADVTLQILESLMRESTPLPSIVPTASGHIQVEWHIKGIDLEVEVASPILFKVAYEDADTGDVWEQDLNVDLRRLDDAVSTLSQR